SREDAREHVGRCALEIEAGGGAGTDPARPASRPCVASQAPAKARDRSQMKSEDRMAHMYLDAHEERMMTLSHRIDRTLVIQAPPSIVFSFLSETPRWAAWWGAGSEIDARPGGRMKIRYPGGREAT